MLQTILLFAVAPLPLIDATVESTLKRWKVPGIVVVVVRRGEEPLIRAYGKASADKSMSADMLFPIASCTKSFTATLIAKLVQDKKLSWDDRVEGFTLADEKANAQLTLRDCLSHRTGLVGHDLLWYRAAWPLDESLKRASRLPLDLPFRQTFRYCSLPVSAAGRAIAVREKMPWQDLVKTHLTDKLDMPSVVFTTNEAKSSKHPRATGHRRTGDTVEAMPEYAMAEPNPAGSMYLTAGDAAKWLTFHLEAGKPVLTAAAHAELFRPNIDLQWDAELRRTNPKTEKMSYGLGWLLYDYRGRRVAAHGGKIDGFRTHFALFPDDGLGIALFNNLHDTTMNQALANTIADRQFNLPALDWNEIFLKAEADTAAERSELLKNREAARKGVVPSQPIAAYAGSFEHPAYGHLNVTVEKSKLTLKWSTFTVQLEPWDGEAFRVVDGFFKEQLVEFRVRAGKVDAVQFAGQVFAR
jgi:CubicO group peptidase (beta-lactamase class C family)